MASQGGIALACRCACCPHRIKFPHVTCVSGSWSVQVKINFWSVVLHGGMSVHGGEAVTTSATSEAPPDPALVDRLLGLMLQSLQVGSHASPGTVRAGTTPVAKLPPGTAFAVELPWDPCRRGAGLVPLEHIASTPEALGAEVLLRALLNGLSFKILPQRPSVQLPSQDPCPQDAVSSSWPFGAACV